MNQNYQQPQYQPQPQQQQTQVPPQYQEAQQLHQLDIPETIQIKLDEETKEIISGTYKELVQTMILISIKRFSETTEYKKYFMKKELRDQKEIETIEEENVSNQPQGSTIPQAVSTPSPKPAFDFTSDDAW